jgi:Zn-dependent metalloprotease
MHRLAMSPLLVVLGVSVLAAQGPATPRIPYGRIAVTSQNVSLLREWDINIDSMLRSGELRRRNVRRDTMLSGRVHERYDQRWDGLRVVGGDIVRQIRNGSTQSIFGQVHPVAGVRTDPALDEEAARAILQRLTTREVPADRRLELVILPREDNTYTLTYETHIWTADGWMKTYLDAHTGDVVLQYNDLNTQAAAVGTGTGVLGDRKKISARALSGRFVADDALRPPTLITYDMQGNRQRTDAYLDGVYQPTTSDIASDTDNVWTDGANVDAHVYLGWTYDYYFKRFNRRGLDDDDAPIFAIVHPVRRADLDLDDDSALDYFINAFWCGGCGPSGRGAMVFGEGLPPGFVLNSPVGQQTVDFFSASLDIVAHELTHGLTDYSSGLIYLNESGALNESLSDVLGVAAEFYYQTAGSGLRQADYLMGEDSIRPGGFRSLADPAAYGDPDHYSRRFTGRDDNGGVHTNSGIPNHAFYLAIEGGVNRTSGLRVTGVGGGNREQIERAFYRAFVNMLPSNATFSNARAATIAAARELYGAGSAPERAITEAWTAVGVQ